MAKDSLTVTDNRTGKSYELPIHCGTFPKRGAARISLPCPQSARKPWTVDFGPWYSWRHPRCGVDYEEATMGRLPGHR